MHFRFPGLSAGLMAIFCVVQPVVAAEGQAISDLATARRSCDRLIVSLEACLRRLYRLRRSLG